MLNLEKENHRKKQPETIKKKKKNTENQSSFVCKGCFLFLFFKTDLGEYFSEAEEFISEHDIQFI